MAILARTKTQFLFIIIFVLVFDFCAPSTPRFRSRNKEKVTAESGTEPIAENGTGYSAVTHSQTHGDSPIPSTPRFRSRNKEKVTAETGSEPITETGAGPSTRHDPRTYKDSSIPSTPRTRSRNKRKLIAENSTEPIAETGVGSSARLDLRTYEVSAPWLKDFDEKIRGKPEEEHYEIYKQFLKQALDGDIERLNKSINNQLQRIRGEEHEELNPKQIQNQLDLLGNWDIPDKDKREVYKTLSLLFPEKYREVVTRQEYLRTLMAQASRASNPRSLNIRSDLGDRNRE